MNNVVYTGNVVGVTFSPTKEKFRACLAHFASLGEANVKPELRLEADPTNIYDKFAVKVLMKNKNDEKEFHIGWLPGPKGGFINKKILEIGIENVQVDLMKVNLFEEKVVGFGIVVTKTNTVN